MDTRPRYLLMLLLCLAVTSSAFCELIRVGNEDPAPAEKEDDLPPCESPSSPPEIFYACLWSGNVRERLVAARLVTDHLPALFGDEDDAAQEAVDNLLLVIRQEPDEWVSRALLEALEEVHGAAVDRLFREVLDAGSMNLVPVVLRRLATVEDQQTGDALDHMWDRDLPEWLRPGLVAALAGQRSTTHLEDLIRLTRAGDDATRRAAVEALGLIGSEEGREALLAAARTGPAWLRARALSSLVELPPAASTLDVALRASHDGTRVLQEAAIDALSLLQDDQADQRLIALLGEPLSEHLRAAAAESLMHSAHPEATDALVRLAHSAAPGSCLRTTALQVLYDRDDPDAVTGLLDLEDGSEEAPPPTVATLVAYLSRARDEGNHQYLGVPGCRDDMADDSAGDGDPQRARPWRVDPPLPLATARCWDGPDLAGDPDDLDRVPAGTPVRITDHFLRPAGEWVSVDGAADDCWLPISQVSGSVASRPAGRRRALPRIEFDMWRRDLPSRPVARLVETGHLEIIEPGDEVVGVALTADPADREQAAFLRAVEGMLPDDGLWSLAMAMEELLKPTRSVDGSASLP